MNKNYCYKLLIITKINNNSNENNNYYNYYSGDKIVFTGTTVVIPDQTTLSKVGEATLGVKRYKK